MIDTIKLRIHDLKLHKQLISRLTSIPNVQTQTFEQMKPNTLGFDVDNDFDISITGKNSDNLRVKVLDYHTGELYDQKVKVKNAFTRYEYKGRDQKIDKDGNIIDIRSKLKGVIPTTTNHYDVNFAVNFYKDVVDIDMSVPKYLYGNNVLQFVQHSETFEQTNDELFAVYSNLIAFIKNFFSFNFEGVPVFYDKVEIVRLDFCYNAVFQSEKDARDYLSAARLVRKKYSRDGSAIHLERENIHGANFHAVNKSRGSYKFYHKGDAYEKFDRKRLNKAFKGTPHENCVTVLSEMSNRMVRYEVTFFGRWLAEIFVKNCFRLKCPIQAAAHQKYLGLRAKTKRETMRRRSFGRMVDLVHKKMKDVHNLDVLLLVASKFEPFKKQDFNDIKFKRWLFESFYPKYQNNLFSLFESKDSLHLILSDIYDYFYSSDIVTVAEQNFFSEQRQMYSKRYNLMVEQSDMSYFLASQYHNTGQNQYIRLSFPFFKEVYKVFSSFVDNYKLSERPDFLDAKQKIMNYKQQKERNKTINLKKNIQNEETVNDGFAGLPKLANTYDSIFTNGINTNILLLLVAALERRTTETTDYLNDEVALDVLLKDLDIATSTGLRYKKALKDIGVYSSSVTNCAIPVSFNYIAYKQWVAENSRNLFSYKVSV